MFETNEECRNGRRLDGQRPILVRMSQDSLFVGKSGSLLHL